MQPYKSKIKTGKKKSIARGAKGTKAKGLPRVPQKEAGKLLKSKM